MNKRSACLLSISPPLWQHLKYEQSMLSKDSGREIHSVGRCISADRAALGIGVHLGFYARHFIRFAKSVIMIEDRHKLARLRALLPGLQAATKASISTALTCVPSMGFAMPICSPVRPDSPASTISSSCLARSQCSGAIVSKHKLKVRPAAEHGGL